MRKNISHWFINRNSWHINKYIIRAHRCFCKYVTFYRKKNYTILNKTVSALYRNWKFKIYKSLLKSFVFQSPSRKNVVFVPAGTPNRTMGVLFLYYSDFEDLNFPVWYRIKGAGNARQLNSGARCARRNNARPLTFVCGTRAFICNLTTSLVYYIVYVCIFIYNAIINSCAIKIVLCKLWPSGKIRI